MDLAASGMGSPIAGPTIPSVTPTPAAMAASQPSATTLQPLSQTQWAGLKPTDNINYEAAIKNQQTKQGGASHLAADAQRAQAVADRAAAAKVVAEKKKAAQLAEAKKKTAAKTAVRASAQ